MPIPQRYDSLIHSLFNLTASQKLEWQSLAGGGLLATLGSESIRLSPAMSLTGGVRRRIGIAISLHNSDGEAVDTFQVRIDEATPYRLISELYDAARRAALGVEDIIRRVEVELERLEQNGEPDTGGTAKPADG